MTVTLVGSVALGVPNTLVGVEGLAYGVNDDDAADKSLSTLTGSNPVLSSHSACTRNVYAVPFTRLAVVLSGFVYEVITHDCEDVAVFAAHDDTVPSELDVPASTTCTTKPVNS